MSMKNEFMQKRVQKFTYKPSVDGGTKNTAIAIGILPKGALIVNGYAHVVNAFGDDDDNSTTLSFGYTGAATAFYAATAVSALTNDVMLKLIPGVLNIGNGALITTVDTPAEIVALSRVAGDTYGFIYLTADKEVLTTVSNDHNVDEGEIDLFIEYVITQS